MVKLQFLLLTVTLKSCLQSLLLGQLRDVNFVVSQLEPLKVLYSPCLVRSIDQSLR